MSRVLKDGWEVRKLCEVCQIGDGNHSSKYPKKNEMTDEGTPFIRAKNMVDGQLSWLDMKYISKEKHATLKKGHLKTNDILFTNRGEIGKLAIVSNDFENSNLNSQIAWFRCNETLNNKFLFYFLLSPLMQKYYLIEKNGAALQQFTIKQINNISFPIPSLQEQKRIVTILDEAFTAIEKAKANAQLNLQNAKELFESYLQGVFENKDESWEEKTLGEIATFRNGMNFTKSSKGEEIQIVGVKNFQKSFWVPSKNLESVTIDGKLNEIDSLKEDDILAVRSNGNPKLIGRTLLAGKISEKVSHSGFTIRIRLNSSFLSSIYLCHYLKTQKTREELIKSGNGVGIKSLNQSSLSSLLIPFPPITEQKQIVKKLNALSNETEKLETNYKLKIQDLEELKKSILQKAFNGEL